MTQRRASHQDPTQPITLLSPKSASLLGTWNVRTMFQPGPATIIANEMKRYKLAILGLSETRWTSSGEMKLADGTTIIHSGHQEDGAPHTEGVAFMLTSESRRAMISWEPINSRIIIARFRTRHQKITAHIIQCYAPTNDSSEEDKDDFYHILTEIVDKVKEKDLVMIMGDFNAKIGGTNRGYEQVMGKHGLGTMNENGERFADFCADCNFVIGGSLFPHKAAHKATWVSPDHITENQIDHISISQKFRRSLLDVRVKRDADAASDHHFLVARVRLKLKRNYKPRNPRIKYNAHYLKDSDTIQSFRVSLSNRFQPLQDLNIEDKWNDIKESLNETCAEVLGNRTAEHKEWITPGTVKSISKRKHLKEECNNSRTRREKAETQKKYETANREVKQKIKQDKRGYYNALATQAEVAAAHGYMKDLYDTTRKLEISTE